jgi:biotin synthase
MCFDYPRWADAGCAGQAIEPNDARAILNGAGLDLMELLAAAGRVRRHHYGNTVSIHVLDNIRSGACPEDCGYCGQSKDSTAPLKPYKLKSVDQIVADATAAKQAGAFRFCMAASGRGPSQSDLDTICQAVTRIKAMGLRTCLSAGLLDESAAAQLAEAGLDRLNHNLNTSRNHYPAICSTHSYDDRIATLQAARAAGLGVCCGLIVGMGETHDDLVDVACELAALKAESIPVNFLLPIEGNPITQPMCNGQPLDPQFVLRVLCMVRLVNPAAEIRIAAGREHHLRSMQAMALWPANSLFMDGYLLTQGDSAEQTLRMILDAGFTPRLDEGAWPEPLRQWVQSANTPTGRLPDLKLNVIK